MNLINYKLVIVFFSLHIIFFDQVLLLKSESSLGLERSRQLNKAAKETGFLPSNLYDQPNTINTQENKVEMQKYRNYVSALGNARRKKIKNTFMEVEPYYSSSLSIYELVENHWKKNFEKAFSELKKECFVSSEIWQWVDELIELIQKYNPLYSQRLRVASVKLPQVEFEDPLVQELVRMIRKEALQRKLNPDFIKLRIIDNSLDLLENGQTLDREHLYSCCIAASQHKFKPPQIITQLDPGVSSFWMSVYKALKECPTSVEFENIIWINYSEFFSFSKPAQEAIIRHEIGHLVTLSHTRLEIIEEIDLKYKKSWLNNKVEDCIILISHLEELYADSLAATKNIDQWKAFKIMLQELSAQNKETSHLASLTHPSLKDRLRFIEKEVEILGGEPVVIDLLRALGRKFKEYFFGGASN